MMDNVGALGKRLLVLAAERRQVNSQGRKPTAVNIFSGHKYFPQL
jgi:hypothetical protein